MFVVWFYPYVPAMGLCLDKEKGGFILCPNQKCSLGGKGTVLVGFCF